MAKSAHSCRRCGRWLEGEWANAKARNDVEEMSALDRQMGQGYCDACLKIITGASAAEPEAEASSPEVDEP